jgi:hypothetical protein
VVLLLLFYHATLEEDIPVNVKGIKMNQYQSESIDQLITALAKAQGEMSSASKDCKGYNYKYADLASVWGACREALSHNGLAVTQIETQTEIGEVLVTILGHSSGQWIRSTMAIRVKPSGKGNELQERGSVYTYLRRYALSAIVGVAPSEDDDDGNAGGKNYQPQQVQSQAPAQVAPKLITSSQAEELKNILTKCSPGMRENIEKLMKDRAIPSFNALGETLYKTLLEKAINDMKYYQASLTQEEPVAI